MPTECSSWIYLMERKGPESLLGSGVVTECHDLQSCRLVLSYDYSTWLFSLLSSHR
mgnify:CR=1 FL=1